MYKLSFDSVSLYKELITKLIYIEISFKSSLHYLVIEKDKYMSEKMNSFYNLRALEELSEKKTIIHKINPTVKILTTLVFLFVTVSFSKYEISAMLPMIFYPIIVGSVGEVPVKELMKRTLITMPLVIGIVILNPFFDTTPRVSLFTLNITAGWISFVSILIRGFLAIMAAQLLIATTGIINISRGLKRLRVPNIFIIQLIFTYRYISLFIEEIGRTTRAYSFRSYKGKGISFNHWGSLVGGLLLRTLDRAERIHKAMLARGFQGEYSVGKELKIEKKDLIYLILWCGYFILVRRYNLPKILKSFIN